MVTSVDNNKRIHILNQSDINDLYKFPKFKDEERQWYFELNNKEEKFLKLSISLASKVDIILQIGYFKAKNQFFKFQFDDVEADVNYILNQYFEQISLEKKIISYKVKRQNQQRVLNLLSYQAYSTQAHKNSLLKRACELSRLSVDPVFIFRELLEFIYNKRISLPGYTTIQDIVSKALSLEQHSINQILQDQLKPEEKKNILNLLQQKDSLYAVTSLKKLPKNFKPKAIYQEIDHFENYSSLHQIAKRILPTIGISNNSILYYANLVEHYTVRGLDRLKQPKACLWLLCFVYHRCKRMIDNLATMFIYLVSERKRNFSSRTRKTKKITGGIYLIF